MSCPICIDDIITPITLPCNHKFCYLCVKGTMTFGNYKCPYCRCLIPDEFMSNAISSKTDSDIKLSESNWMYRGKLGGWWFYQNDHNSIIEKAWRDFVRSRSIYTSEEMGEEFTEFSQPEAEILVGSSVYKIDFIRMVQISNYGIERRVKRVLNAVFEDAKGVAGVRYVEENEVPKYEILYPEDNRLEFNPHYADFDDYEVEDHDYEDEVEDYAHDDYVGPDSDNYIELETDSETDDRITTTDYGNSIFQIGNLNIGANLMRYFNTDNFRQN